MGLLTWDKHGCQAVPEAELQKAFSALLRALFHEPCALCDKKRGPSCELEKSEFCCTHGVVKQILQVQNRSAARVAHSPRAMETISPKQEGAICVCAMFEHLEYGFCTSNGSVKDPLMFLERSAIRNVQERTFTAAGDRIRSHPNVTLVVLLALNLFLVLALGVSLAVQAGGKQKEIPLVPDSPKLLACPNGWVGYLGICYLLSRDERSWDQAQAQCSELGASLAVLRDEEMDLLFHLCGNLDYWLGLRRWGEQLQWGDGSSFNSSVEDLGNGECVFLGNGKFRLGSCSNPRSYVCSRAQTLL